LDICVHQGVSDLAPPRRDASDVNQREPPTLGHPLEEPPTAFTYLGVEKFLEVLAIAHGPACLYLGNVGRCNAC